MPVSRIARIEIVPAKVGQWRSRSKRAVFVRMYSAKVDLRTEWEEWLLVAVFHDRSGAFKLPPVTALETWRRASLNSGERIGYAHVRPGRASRAAALRLRTRVLREARATGGRVLEVQIVHPFGVGFAVVLQTAHPARFLRYRVPRLLRALDDRWRRMEGGYFRVVDSRGHPVWTTAGSSRLSAGGGWIRPDLEGCDPTPPMSVPIGHKIPRCPA